MRHILWGVACDVTKHGRHPRRHLGFYEKLEISLKRPELVLFCA